MALLSAAQKAVVKADILADATLNSFPNNSDGNLAVAAIYNIVSTADFRVWRTSVMKSELTNVTTTAGTTFTWAGNGYITRSQGERDAFVALFNAQNAVNPSLTQVRVAFSDIFSGTGNAAANRAHLLAAGQRASTRIEKLLVASTDAGTTAAPALMGFEGPVSPADIEAARNLP